MAIGNIRDVECLPTWAVASKKFVLWRYRLRDAVIIALRWLATRSSDDTPDTAATGSSHRASTSLHLTADQAAFEQLFARYRLPLLNYLYGMTRDRAIAEDLVQETFLRAYAAETTLTNVTHPQAWLYRIATNLALDISRRQRRLSWLPLNRVEPEAGPDDSGTWSNPRPLTLLQDDIAVSVAERDAVWRVLAELPPRWRAVLLLQTTAGFGAREIGALLHLEEGNIRKILFRAKERFRTLYTALDTGETSKMEGDQP